jgi:sigma-B regulation protein RsbU (phosphoserine phosphatase)
MVLRRGRDKAGAAIEDDSTISRRAVREAVTSGAPFSISDTFADDLAAEWSSLKEHRIRSIYCIPLRGRGEGGLLGLLYLDSQVGPGGLTVVDRQLLEMIATEATALLHNALLAEQEYTARQAREELAVAARIHSGLMATALPRVAYAEIEARSLPCLAIGGDFYDVVALDEAVGITIADVSGKGVSAAIVAATLQGIIHAEMLSGHGLVEIAGLVNRFLCGRSVGKYATMVMLKIHADGRVEYVNCGHVQPVTVYGNEVRRLEAGNLVVGLIEGAGYEAAEIYLRAGERLLLATDGVTEAEDAEGRLFGDCLDEVLGVTRDLDELLGRVVAFQETAGAGGFQDDCTLLEVRYTGG